MASARPVYRVARELAALLAAAAALGLIAWWTHGAAGAAFVAACWLAGAAAVGLTELLSPRCDRPFAPVARYLIGGLLRVALLLLVPVLLIDRNAPHQGVLVVYAFGMLVVLLASEVRESALANARANNTSQAANAR